MFNEENIPELWLFFKEYADKKNIEIAAEKFIDLLADHGVSDQTLKECLGNCQYLDSAVNYYLDDDDESYIDEDY